MSTTLHDAMLGADSTTCGDQRAKENGGGLFAKFRSKGPKANGGDGSVVVPKAHAFPPEMLAELGYRTNESGELEKTEPQLSPPGGCSQEALVTIYGSKGPKAGDTDSLVAAPKAQAFPPEMLAELEEMEPLSPPGGCSREVLVTTYTAYPSYILGAGAGCLGCYEFWKGYAVTVPAGSCGATGKGCCCCCGATAVSTHAKSFPCCDPAGHILWSNAWRNFTHLEYDMGGSCDCCDCCDCCHCCSCCSCQQCGPTYVSCGPVCTWAVPCVVGCCLCCVAAHYCDPEKRCGDLDLIKQGSDTASDNNNSLKKPRWTAKLHDMNRG